MGKIGIKFRVHKIGDVYRAEGMGKVESEVVFSMLLLYSSSKFKDIAFHIQAISLHQ